MKSSEQISFDFDAFVSYSHTDSERVRRLYVTLTEKFKLRLFLDEKNIGIGPLHEQCAEGIRRSRSLVIVCSRSSLKSDWVLAEHDMMRTRDPRGQSIIPLVLDESKLPLQLGALYWLDFRNRREDGINSAKLAALLLRRSQPTSESIRSTLIEHGSSSPYCGFGIIPLKSRCYVRRGSDIDLRQLVANKSFVWVQGNYRLGKSSLLVRHADWVPKGWHISRPSLELCGRERFWKAFFREVQRTFVPLLGRHEFDPADKWQGLLDLSLKVPVALILDEIGVCDGSKGHELLRALLAIREAAPERFKCIASFKGLPQDYLSICRCDEPKLRDCWQVISLVPFDGNEVLELVALLPQPIASVITTRISEVEQATSFLPHAVQQLLNGIWDTFEGFPISDTAVIDSIIGEQLASFSAT